MLVLAVIGMAIPSLLATIGESTRPGAIVVRGFELHELSIGVSIILLLCYAAYIAYSVFGLRAPQEDRLSFSESMSGDEVEGKHNTIHTKGQEGEAVVRGKARKEILLRYWPDGGGQRSGFHSPRWLALQQLPL